MDASLRWHDGNWVRAAWLPLNQPARPADPHQQPVGSVERAFDHAPGFVLGGLAGLDDVIAHCGRQLMDARRVEVDAERVAHVDDPAFGCSVEVHRSEEHTSELQSLMRISYAVFCLHTQMQSTPLYKTT